MSNNDRAALAQAFCDISSTLQSLQSQQLQVAQALSKISAASSATPAFLPPPGLTKAVTCDGIRKQLDKQSLKIYQDWELEAKKRVESFLQQIKLQDKYNELHEQGKIHADLMAEKQRKWQWPAYYVEQATSMTDDQNSCDIHEEWARMRDTTAGTEAAA